MTMLNPYDHDLDLAKKEVMELYMAAITPRKYEDTYDLISENFETFHTKVLCKVQAFYLGKDNNFSAGIDKDSTTLHIITSCYGKISLMDLKTQVNPVWVNGSNNLKKDNDTLCR